ncbi:MAG TPA: hypothetical protein VJN42_07410 [Candidatus Acidoferrum sp.]|nr:hypothetical protein [Candidatus Acidoferrum sp.]
MRQRYGKFYARWTGADGKRHEKAFNSRREAEAYNRRMRKKRRTDQKRIARQVLAATQTIVLQPGHRYELRLTGNSLFIQSSQDETPTT